MAWLETGTAPFYRVDRVFWKAIDKFGLTKSRAQGLGLIEESLQAVDLRPADVLGRYPHQLSGGQRQRVMLARVHMLRPAFIIADEPISMLDAAVRVLFLNVLLDFKERYGMTTLFITHDLSTAYYLGGEIMVISQGRIVERGHVDDVMNRPAHPYTQQLLSSVPVPDPDRRWTERITVSEQTAAVQSLSRERCLFAERCPHVMDRCWQERPERGRPGGPAGALLPLRRRAADGRAPRDDGGRRVRLMLAGALLAVVVLVGAVFATGAVTLTSAAPPARAAAVATAAPPAPAPAAEATPSEAERAAAQLQLQAEESQYCQCGK